MLDDNCPETLHDNETAECSTHDCHIRPVLRWDMVRAVATSLTQTRLDFANSVLIGISGSNISKLQRVQNCFARVVLQDKNNSATSLLSELHWLPVNKRNPFAQLIRICYLCHAATAVSDKEVFPTVPLKSGMTYHFWSDSPLHSTALSTT